MMKRWWCMDCRTSTELNKHGKCEACDSEAVDLIGSVNVVTHSVSNTQAEIAAPQMGA